MPNPYSMDLRERAIARVPRSLGSSPSPKPLSDGLRRYRAEGVLKPRPHRGDTASGLEREVFRALAEEILAPTLRPGQVVVLHNLPAHKYPEVEHAVHRAGCRLLFLPG